MREQMSTSITMDSEKLIALFSPDSTGSFPSSFPSMMNRSWPKVPHGCGG
jgi:hypothetical protein